MGTISGLLLLQRPLIKSVTVWQGEKTLRRSKELGSFSIAGFLLLWNFYLSWLRRSLNKKSLFVTKESSPELILLREDATHSNFARSSPITSSVLVLRQRRGPQNRINEISTIVNMCCFGGVATVLQQPTSL